MHVFDVKNSVNLKNSYGGTSTKNIKKMISKLKKEVPNMNTSEIPNEDHIESLDFIVNGMTCSHCKESVESSIKSK